MFVSNLLVRKWVNFESIIFLTNKQLGKFNKGVDKELNKMKN